MRAAVAVLCAALALVSCGPQNSQAVPGGGGANGHGLTKPASNSGSASPCVLNSSDTTGQTVDCYADYNTTFRQDWNIVGNNVPYDLDDGSGSSYGIDPGGNDLMCGPMATSYTAQGGSLTVTVQGGTLPPCPDKGGPQPVNTTPVSIYVTAGAPGTDGKPYDVTMSLQTSLNRWDPSDLAADPDSVAYTMIVHVGLCAPPGGTSATRRTAQSSPRSAERATSVRRHALTGGIAGAILTYAKPVLGTFQSTCITPPPPVIAKTLYTASLQSSPVLSFTDAADSSFGNLTWNFSANTTALTNMAFATLGTSVPHGNTLSFNVPIATPPGDYPIHVNVTSTATNRTSADTVVTLRVLPPATYQSELNAGGTYEEDSSGNVIVSDGSQYVTDDDGQTPDFPITGGSGVQTTVRRPQQEQITAPFDPLNPPQTVADDLQKLSKEKRFGCFSYIVDDNVAHDRTDSRSQGTLQVFAYCTNLWVAPGILLRQYGTNLNNPAQTAQRLPNALLACSNQVGLYGDYHVCSTGLYDVVPVLKHAEKMNAQYQLQYGSLFSWVTTLTTRGGEYYINDRGAFYPKIPIFQSWALPIVYARGGGFVPFPKGSKFLYCGPDAPTPCLSKSQQKALRGILLNAGVAPPPAGFQAHHIHERVWCGQNDKENGVFLPTQDADDEQEYTSSHSKFTDWWAPYNFTPDLPVPLCK